MNDLEICKRIAEIEGVTVRDTGEDLEWIKCPKTAIEPKYDDYNPLTDDGLCFRLMVKYNCKLSKYSDGFSAYSQWDHLNSGRELTESPNKAICLSIIAAHKDV